MLEVLRKQAADKRKPLTTLEQLLEGLAKSVPHFVEDVRAHQLKAWNEGDVDA